MELLNFKLKESLLREEISPTQEIKPLKFSKLRIMEEESTTESDSNKFSDSEEYKNKSDYSQSRIDSVFVEDDDEDEESIPLDNTQGKTLQSQSQSQPPTDKIKPNSNIYDCFNLLKFPDVQKPLLCTIRDYDYNSNQKT